MSARSIGRGPPSLEEVRIAAYRRLHGRGGRITLACRMNKSGLVAEVAKRTDRNRTDVAAIVDETMAVIRDTVAKGERVALVGFGTFEKRRRNKRVARNPRKP